MSKKGINIPRDYIDCHHFHYCWKVNKPRFQNLVDDIMKEFVKNTDLKRYNRTCYRAHISLILTNLLRTYNSPYSKYLAISKNKNDYYKIPNRYTRGTISPSYSAIDEVLNFFEKKSLISRHKHYHTTFAMGRSFRTRYSLTDKLKKRFSKYFLSRTHVHRIGQTETIILKDKPNAYNKKRLLAYRDTPKINEWRSNVENLNSLLDQTTITDAGNNKLPNIFFKRVFNDNCFNNKTKYSGKYFGGRFYCARVQNLPEAERKQLTINGNPVIELDYQAIHIHLLYQQNGKSYTGDPYRITGIPSQHRNMVKFIFLIALNAKSEANLFQTVHDKLKTLDNYEKDYAHLSSEDYKAYLNFIKAQHSAINHCFFTGQAKFLQYQDSHIAEEIINTFVAKGIPILPVHDSFIVPKKYKTLLERTMKKQFASYPGNIAIKQ
ncbi:MAG TPA: hypothetical protein PKC21_04965 [Oligoflexia bacterium]|nr:hypothetical protein [Oligoflexia bacterium]HMR24687.1 hypothetical protein [Oligoflexia bacterium]